MSTTEERKLFDSINTAIDKNVDKTATYLALIKLLLQDIHKRQTSPPVSTATNATEIAALKIELQNLRDELAKIEHRSGIPHPTDGIYLDKDFLQKFNQLISIFYSYHH